MHTPKGRFTKFAYAWALLGLSSVSHYAAAQAGTSAVTETDLDAATVVTLVPGEHFRISAPLRPSRAVNLGAARLDVTLERNSKGKQAEPELHLLAILTAVQTTLNAGDAQLMLHGVAPDFGSAREGEYHPSDYSIHLGSGNVTNIGVPDDKLIDTDRLTKKLQTLRIHLKASPR